MIKMNIKCKKEGDKIIIFLTINEKERKYVFSNKTEKKEILNLLISTLKYHKATKYTTELIVKFNKLKM